LASFWLKQSFENRTRIETALIGLGQIAKLEPLISMEVSGNDTQGAVYQEHLEIFRSHLTAQQNADLSESIESLRARSTQVTTLTAVHRITTSLTQSSKLLSVTPSESIALPELISHFLLPVLIESTRIVKTLETMTNRNQFNDWDRMSVPVQGGQFKISADLVSRLSRSKIISQSENYSQKIKKQAEMFRQSNLRFQGALGVEVRKMAMAKSGGFLSLNAVQSAHAELLKQTNEYWKLSVEYLQMKLVQERENITFDIYMTAAIGAAIILSALGAILMVSRAFSARTIQEIDYASFHDRTTGLPNRRSLIKKLSYHVANASEHMRANQNTLAFHIDLARIKLINDSLGELVGDKLLKQVADNLIEVCGDAGDTYRVGGNEYMILLHGNTNEQDIDSWIEKFHTTIRHAGNTVSDSLDQKACIGVAMRKTSDLVVEELLSDAALALASAKRAKTAGYCIFSPEIRDAFEKRNKIAHELETAIANDHIEVWLQPQINLTSCTIVGAEALVRWVDPEKGVQNPGEFLQVAEEAGLMSKLDCIVRQKGMAAISRINDQTGLELSLGLNMTAEFLSSEDCVDLLVHEATRSELDPEKIDIEILESVAIDERNASAIKDNIKTLSQKGFHIDLDDFGTGHASISSLRDLHVDRVKIDRSFIVDIHENENLQTFSNALIQLSKSLNIQVLAEGIEREEEVRWLAKHGCDYIQGYLVSKPLPERELLRMLMEQDSKAAA